MNAKGCAVSDTLPVSPSYGLHDYQRQVVDDLLHYLNPRDRSLVIPSRRVVTHLPTGAGKTRIASHVACHLLAARENSILVWLASTEELCDQAADELGRAWSHLGNREVRVHRFWGNSSLILNDLPDGFLVAGLGKIRAAADRASGALDSISRRSAGVIFDEAHQAIASTYSYVTELLLGHDPPLMGLTATPGRQASPGEQDFRLAEMFNSNKVSIDPRGYPDPVTYLISNDYLAEPEFIELPFDNPTLGLIESDADDYTPEELSAIGRDSNRNQLIVEKTVDVLQRMRRVIVFCPSVSSAEQCAQSVRAHGIGARSITASTPSEERQTIIADFKSDTSDRMALFNYAVLTAGFDAPRTRCAIIARPTKSLVLYSQMVGRAMRGTRSGGNKRCEIYTVVDTSLPGFGSVVEAFGNWEEIWRSN